jgi:hypothetical protein
MAFIDQNLLMLDNALVASATSDTLDFGGTEYSTETNSPANYLNIEITADTTGALTTKLQDSADNSTFADVAGITHTFASGADAGVGVSILLPTTLRRYAKAVNATATAGSVSVWIGQKKF